MADFLKSNFTKKCILESRFILMYTDTNTPKTELFGVLFLFIDFFTNNWTSNSRQVASYLVPNSFMYHNQKTTIVFFLIIVEFLYPCFTNLSLKIATTTILYTNHTIFCLWMMCDRICYTLVRSFDIPSYISKIILHYFSLIL